MHMYNFFYDKDDYTVFVNRSIIISIFINTNYNIVGLQMNLYNIISRRFKLILIIKIKLITEQITKFFIKLYHFNWSCPP